MYWDQRARAARHPTLRTRYADLVWEFGRRAKQSVTADLPRLVIDATLLRLGVGEEMVKVHRGRVMEKMRAGSLAELVRLADEGGVISPHAASPSSS